MWTLLISCLIHSSLEIVQKNQKRFFKNKESFPFLYINLKWRAKFQIYRLQIHDSDWLNFMHFLGYKYNRLVWILRKREDQAIISISTVLKFSVQKELELVYHDILRFIVYYLYIYILDINGLFSFFSNLTTSTVASKSPFYSLFSSKNCFSEIDLLNFPFSPQKM